MPSRILPWQKRPFVPGNLTILDKLILVPIVALIGIVLFGAFILDLFGVTMKPRKAAGYK